MLGRSHLRFPQPYAEFAARSLASISSKSPRLVSSQSSRRPGMAAAAHSTKNQIQPVAAATKPSDAARLAALRSVREIARAWGGTRPEKRRLLIRGLARTVALGVGQAPRFDWFSAEEIARRSA